MDRRTVIAGGLLAAGGLVAAPRLSAATKVHTGQAQAGQWIFTTEGRPWQAGPVVAWGKFDPASGPNVFINTSQSFQVIEGFGACFNELGWDAINALPAKSRTSIFNELFSDAGAGFTLGRLPVGANDFSRDWYSYDETPGDFSLSRFSIARDETGLIPFIRAAKAMRPELKLWASPWSPPTWMKNNGHYASVPNYPGRPPNGMKPGQGGREGTDMFIQDNRYLDAYARYFGKFVDAYARRGIPIAMVMPQNEFNSAQPYPSCCWTPEGLARFLPYLGREMDKRSVEVFFGTLERANDQLFEKAYAAPGLKEVIKGVGVQWAGKGALPFIHRAHPDLRFYQTEQECGDGRNDWRYARYAWSMMKSYLQNGANAYFYWNIALMEGGVGRRIHS